MVSIALAGKAERKHSLSSFEEFMTADHPTRDPRFLQSRFNTPRKCSISQENSNISIIDHTARMCDKMLDSSGDVGGFGQGVGCGMEDERRASGMCRFE